MSNKNTMKTLSIAAGAAFIASLTIGSVANAAEGANPFAINELSSGYMQLAGSNHSHSSDKKMEGKCGGSKKMEGKCGGDKKMKKEGKCGEGKCGGDKKMKKMEGKCGGDKKVKKMEGKCGGDKKVKKEGKCGEGKCGGSK